MKIFIQLLLVLLSWLPLHASLVPSQANHGETAFSELTTRINDYTEATKKNLLLAGDAADNMKLVLGKTGEQLAKITDKGLIRRATHKIFHETPYGNSYILEKTSN